MLDRKKASAFVFLKRNKVTQVGNDISKYTMTTVTIAIIKVTQLHKTMQCTIINVDSLALTIKMLSEAGNV